MKSKLAIALFIAAAAAVFFYPRQQKFRFNLFSQDLPKAKIEILELKGPEGLGRPAIDATRLSQKQKMPGTIEEGLAYLESKYKAKLNLTRDRDGTPFRLSGEMKLREDMKSQEEAAADFLADAAPALGIDHPEQLAQPKEQNGALGDILNYQQNIDGILVVDAQVRTHINNKGEVFMVNSTYRHGIDPKQIDLNPSVSAEEALNIAMNHALSLDPAPQEHATPNHQGPVKVIYRFSAINNYDIAWQITISQPWLGVEHAVGQYFVNGHRPNVWERRENAIQ